VEVGNGVVTGRGLGGDRRNEHVGYSGEFDMIYDIMVGEVSSAITPLASKFSVQGQVYWIGCHS
jgi:hypothetical protein